MIQLPLCWWSLTFLYVFWPCVFHLWELSVRLNIPFIDCIVWFLLFIILSSLYVLDINSVKCVPGEDFFPHSLSCSFTQITVSFALQSSIVSGGPTYQVLVLVPVLTKAMFKKSFPVPVSSRIFLVYIFSIKTYIEVFDPLGVEFFVQIKI